MAEIVTDVELVTAKVVTVNVALVLPAGTMTLAGTLAAFELSLSDTVRPLLGAGPFIVTVPWDVLPPTTLVGLKVKLLNTGGLTVSEAVLATPP